MVAVNRSGATEGTATVVNGGAVQTRAVRASTQDELETAIAAAKAEIGGNAPFFSVQRHVPFTFTVTRLSQLLTAYYFLFFLIILPLLGLREKPGRVPDTIAKPVTTDGQAQGAS